MAAKFVFPNEMNVENLGVLIFLMAYYVGKLAEFLEKGKLVDYQCLSLFTP